MEQMLSLEDFDYVRSTGTLVAKPGVKIDTTRPLFIKSHFTGHIARFEYDHIRAVLNEFWDGEYSEMVNTDHMHKIKIVVVGIHK